MDSISVSRFKAEALAIVERVASGGGEVIITKRGRPVVRLVPVVPPAALVGSVRFLVSDEDLISPIGADWDAERGA